ncbi:MAG: winged helix-turn-helix transcriptional regulator [Chloroflexi bacterium]|nr:winged helix-turn-helix transcriptional regulator [Chloroflexota bacterium]
MREVDAPRETLDIGERELEILRLVADGLSNQEIAETTYLSLNTVKWYLKEIFGKLYVKNRTQAVQRARDWNLLEPAAIETDVRTTGEYALPYALTPFVGRATELEQLAQLLADPTTRLITLYGIGGIGKTRLALQVAEQNRHMFGDGVVYVPLSAAIDTDTALRAIAEELGLRRGGTTDLQADIVALLRKRSVLLLLDSAETVPNIGALVARLLIGAPNLKALVTSREALHVPGETVLSLDGVQFPTGETANDGAASDAVKMFLHIASNHNPGMIPSAADLAEVAAICRSVEGMPLAIEIAAEWSGLLSFADIRREITRNLDLLQSDSTATFQRTRSVRAVIDWSWARLDEVERNALCSLSVLVESFSVEAALAVSGATIKSLKVLLEKALLRRSGVSRFVMHDLVRQYATEQRKRDPELNAAAERRSAEHFAGQVDHEAKALFDTMEIRRFANVQSERGHIDRAWAYAVDHQRFDLVLQLSQVGCWSSYVPWAHEAEVWFDRALSTLDFSAHPAAEGRLLAYSVIARYHTRSLASIPDIAWRSADLLAGTPYQVEAGIAVAWAAIVYPILEQHDKVADTIAEARRLVETNVPPASAYARWVLEALAASTAVVADDLENAIAMLDALLDRLPHGASWIAPLLMVVTGECHLLLGNVTRARDYFVRGRFGAESVKDPLPQIQAVYYLSRIERGGFDLEVLATGLYAIADQVESLPLTIRMAHHFATYLGYRSNLDASREMNAVALVLALRLGDAALFREVAGRIISSSRDQALRSAVDSVRYQVPENADPDSLIDLEPAVLEVFKLGNPR